MTWSTLCSWHPFAPPLITTRLQPLQICHHARIPFSTHPPPPPPSFPSPRAPSPCVSPPHRLLRKPGRLPATVAPQGHRVLRGDRGRRGVLRCSGWAWRGNDHRRLLVLLAQLPVIDLICSLRSVPKRNVRPPSAMWCSSLTRAPARSRAGVYCDPRAHRDDGALAAHRPRYSRLSNFQLGLESILNRF